MKYIAVIQKIGDSAQYESTEDFETYGEAYSFMQEHLPSGYEGYVEQLPEVNLEEICIAQERFDNQSH